MDQVERPDASRNNVEERDDAFNSSVCYCNPWPYLNIPVISI